MEITPKDYELNYFVDEINMGFAKEHHKIKSLEDSITYAIKRGVIDDNDREESLNLITPLLNNKQFVMCNLPIVRYQTKTHSINDLNSLEVINTHLEKNQTVLFYSTEMDGRVLKLRSKLL